MIRNYNVIRSILSEPWLISTDEAEKFGFMLSGLFSPNMAFEPITKEDTASAAFVRQVNSGSSKTIQNIGVVNITGALTKYDTWCSYGMQSYGNMIEKFNSMADISAIVLNIDSPGGTVVGTEELGEVIKNCSKPIIAFTSDLACSAAYWLASCCNEIIANNTTAEVGSIGVITSYIDVSAYYDKQGIKIHEILPKQSKDKREEDQQVKLGNYEITEARLGVIADKFHSIVKANRKRVEDSQLTGKVYYAQDVVGSLIDSIGTFESALLRAAELATNTNNKKNKESMSKPLFPTLATAAGVETFESVDGSITLTSEMAAFVETALLAAAGSAQQLADSQASLTTATTTIESLRASITTKDERIAQLEKSPGAPGATVSPSTDGDAGATAPATNFPHAMQSARKFASQFKGE